MNLQLLTKLSIASLILTGITGATAVQSISGINNVINAQENHPNAEFFKVKAGDITLDLTSMLNENRLSAKVISERLTELLKAQGEDPKNYSFKFKVKHKGGGGIEGGSGSVEGNPHIGTQTANFDPKVDKIEEFIITKKS
ncbi:hypothetical protein KJB58_11225 [Staphylococcus hyicus]|uniref:Uncharacterized protein n=1 Tax=Staphylococcus hyicus TaxID=1284 RepID=A0A418JIM4_STAHY|nr:hypothetical protein [Staphylococcus hyicus]MCE5155022.1 hypothetical protein [Staphylococcus hyicus]RIO45610.1 hypothetical protein BUZ57_06970 [Staphylococcus hyicus]